jgi:heme A synthase
LSFLWLSIATTLTTYCLIVLGGVVRTTDSGDACPDWPRCHGEIIPPFETDVMIEFSHRLLASVVGFLVLAVAISAWRGRQPAALRWGSVLALGLVGGQVILGGVTVLSDLSAGVVMAHLAMASTLLATLIALACLAGRGSAPTAREGSRRTSVLTALVALSVFGLMMTGSYVTGSGAGLAFDDWPLFNGSLLPDGGRLAMIHAGHRLTALVVGVLLGYAVWQTRSSRQTAVRHGLRGALFLYVAQALVGAANIWSELHVAAAAAHLALAAAVWGMLVTVAVLTFLETEPSVLRNRRGRAETMAPAGRATAAAGGPR